MGTREQEVEEQERLRQEQLQQEQERRAQGVLPDGDDELSTNPVIINR